MPARLIVSFAHSESDAPLSLSGASTKRLIAIFTPIRLRKGHNEPEQTRFFILLRLALVTDGKRRKPEIAAYFSPHHEETSAHITTRRERRFTSQICLGPDPRVLGRIPRWAENNFCHLNSWALKDARLWESFSRTQKLLSLCGSDGVGQVSGIAHIFIAREHVKSLSAASTACSRRTRAGSLRREDQKAWPQLSTLAWHSAQGLYPRAKHLYGWLKVRREKK